ncbi:HNH endonuclease [Nocardia sp. CC227C]|uniref:HNH endonuclease n=1 Tax=Nocardia sp. CC227C TaxID=3044562 RepID=UPI00278BEF7A|nr:HNH endonuclease signature motif containing protein [Nocardia sp. CC227C]
MGRELAQIPTRLHREPAFHALTAAQQHTLLMLCLRPELNALGIMNFLPGRIASLTSDLDAGAVEKNMRDLAHRGWIVIDDDEFEIFICRYMEFNGVGKNPNRLRRAIEEADKTRSLPIKAAAARALAAMTRLDARKAAKRLSRPAISRFVRQEVYERDSWRCVYCGYAFDPVDEGAPEDQEAGIWLELDHVKPFLVGGEDTVENLRAACSTCNRQRGVDDADLWADRIGGA